MSYPSDALIILLMTNSGYSFTVNNVLAFLIEVYNSFQYT